MSQLRSHYGCTFGAQGNLKPVPDRIATMSKMGIDNMRLFCSWDAIELKDPDTGAIHFDFTILDGVIKLANQAGIAVTYVLDSAPEWHTDATLCQGKAFMKPEDAAAFLVMIAHRYTLGDPLNHEGLYIVGVEEANEGYSDGADHCQIGPYAAKLSQAVYPAVKAVNPNLVVGSPAIIGLQLSYITSWWEAFYSNGGLSDYDGFHFYTQLMPNATPQPGMANFQMYYQTMAAVQAKYGHAEKTIRCGEVGIAVPGKNNTTWQQQADFYLAALDLARKSDGKVEMVELFTIGAGGFSPVEGEGDKEIEHELVAAHASYVKQYPTWDTPGTGGKNVTLLPNFPMVSQRTTVTSDGKASEDALYDCVPASIGAVMLWLEGKSAWDSTINPDKLKDAAYGDVYTGGTSASKYVNICKSMGFALTSIDTADPAHTVALARQMLSENKAVIFTELDPYVDTRLPQYAGWTHVCVWIGDDSSGLTAMDPFIAQPVYKSDGTWESLLRANQVWTVEKEPEIVTISLTNGAVAKYFRLVNGDQWFCSQTGKIIHGAILACYVGYGNADLCGLTFLGLPKSDEIPIENINPVYQHLAGKGIVVQFYECGSLIYDPAHLVDSRPGLTASVYPAHIYDDNAPGLDPAINQLEAEITQLKASQGNPQMVADVHQAVALNQQSTALLSKY